MTNYMFLPAQAPAVDPGPAVDLPADPGPVGAHESEPNPRNPDARDVHFMRAPYPVQPHGSVMPFQFVPGVPSRPTMHPAPPTGTLHNAGLDAPGTGAHGELVQTASYPSGQQQPWVVQPKTFRAPPAPMDGDVFVGWVPAQPVGDG